VLDGIPPSLPALLLADKVIGKAQKLGVLESEATPAFALEDEDQLGGLLLALVLSAKHQGLDAERALRETIRELQVEIRTFELSDDFDAGVVGKG
jgi:XTP/dITP diphosphohydrolase